MQNCYFCRNWNTAKNFNLWDTKDICQTIVVYYPDCSYLSCYWDNKDKLTLAVLAKVLILVHLHGSRVFQFFTNHLTLKEREKIQQEQGSNPGLFAPLVTAQTTRPITQLVRCSNNLWRHKSQHFSGHNQTRSIKKM